MIEVGDNLATLISICVIAVCATVWCIARWHFECKYEALKRKMNPE